MARLCIVISEQDERSIRKFVEEGYALNTSDFVRQSIRSYMADLKSGESRILSP